MTRDPGRLRAVMATLIVASTVLFVVGVFIERGTGSATSLHVEATSPPTAASPAPHVEGAGESGGEGAASTAPEASGESAGEAAGT